MKRLRTAVIGTGFMGRVHLEALRRVEFVDVAAICGRTQDAAVKLGEPFGISAAFSNYRDILQDDTIDAVHICTPNKTHYQIAKDALIAGKHVLCEKPWLPPRMKPESWWQLHRSGSFVTAHAITCAITPWFSRCAGCGKRAI